jgi:hypothetical protein
MKLDEVFVVKVQLPLYSSDPQAMSQALVYDRTRKKINDMIQIDEHIVRAMRGRPKAFFRAGFEGDTFYLGTESEVPDPGW